MRQIQLDQLMLEPNISADVSILAATPAAGVDAGASLPLEGSRAGSIFEDRFDPGLRWYVPTVVLAPAPDPDFSFAATRVGVGSGGDPFDTVVVTVGLLVSEPPDVSASRSADPTLVFKPVCPVDGLGVTLTVSSLAADGSTVRSSFPMSVTTRPVVGDSTGTAVTASARLQGPDVIVLFENLRTTGAATLTVSQVYGVWRQGRSIPWRFPHPFPHPFPAPVLAPLPARPPDGGQGGAVSPSLLSLAHVDRSALVEQVTAPLDMTPPVHPQVPFSSLRLSQSDLSTARLTLPASDALSADEPQPGRIPTDPPPAPTYVQADDDDTATLDLGTVFATDPFRVRYTLTDAGTTRTIIDVSDLLDFQTVRSEFRELTSLGPVSARYPSIRSIYVGQVSGTVIVLPAQYAIARGSSGCAARGQAVVDDSPTTLSGCRFELSFKVVANIDPADLAQLTTDLAATPEARDLQLHVSLPSGLDSHTAPTFTGMSAATVTVVDDVGGALVVGVALNDDGPTPAVTNVNLLLHALSVATVPLTGEVAVRLDDAYPHPVTTSVVLSLRTTVGTDDLAVTIPSQDPSHLSVTNAGPFDEQLLSVTGFGTGMPTREVVDVTLPQGATTLVGLPEGQTNGIVHSQLVVPDPMPAGQVFTFVPLDVQTVAQLRHPLGFNATAIDFAAFGLRQLDVQPSITALPDLTVSAVTLTPDHRVDSVDVAVPIATALSGLVTTLTMTMTHADGSTTQAELTHDFLDDPVVVLTPSQLS